MTFTNHIRKIQEHADWVIKHVDARDYPKAHVDLDNIEANVRSVRDHIETIQSCADCSARPPGPLEKFVKGVIKNEHRE